MKYIELSNTITSNDCIIIWNYLKENPGVMLYELKEKFGTKKWIEEYKRGKSFCSNLIYVIKKLKRIGAIEVIQNRHNGGEFDYATINLIAEPIIRTDLLICIECSKEFNKKTSKSKYKDLCLTCTERKFMTAKNALCVYCKTYGTRRKMRSFARELYHQECYKKYSDLRREAKIEALKEKRQKRRYCQICAKVEIYKSGKFCKDCNRERQLARRSIKNCFACGILLKNYHLVTCDNIDCKVIYYSKSDAYFNGRKSDSSISFLLKKKILGESCVVCGYDAFINYHHVIFRENGGKDVLSNIVPLCPNHHMEVHHRGLDISEHHKQVLNRLDLIASGVIKIDLQNIEA